VRCNTHERRASIALFVAVCFFGCAHAVAVPPAAPPPPPQQTLGVRAPAFAQYVVAMHRRIHKLFTAGFLADIDARNDPAYADQTLWTQLAIAVDANGGVASVVVLRESGVPAFDVAAADSVRAAAPFPPPPDAVKSRDGKVHLDWQFHRDERGCTTIGVEPHLFGIVRAEEAEAREVSEAWFMSYVRGDAPWLAGWSATPFIAEGEVIARDAATLKAFYATMVAAKPSGEDAFTDLKVLTPAEMRSAAGMLPDGGAADMLFATAHVASGAITLFLKKSSQGWRVCGIAHGRILKTNQG
jgi:TonB family protein